MALRLVDDDLPDPWMRQATEPTGAFELFKIFRDMGASRSYGRTALTAEKSVAYISNLARQWDWVARATAWDDEQDRIWLGEVRDARRNAARRHQSVAMRMLDIVDEELTARAELVAVLRMAAQAGDHEAVHELGLDPDQLVRWATAAVKIERLAIGAPSEIHDTRSSSIAVVANGDAERTRAVIEDPVAREMAMNLLERMQLEQPIEASSTEA